MPWLHPTRGLEKRRHPVALEKALTKVIEWIHGAVYSFCLLILKAKLIKGAIVFSIFILAQIFNTVWKEDFVLYQEKLLIFWAVISFWYRQAGFWVWYVSIFHETNASTIWHIKARARWNKLHALYLCQLRTQGLHCVETHTVYHLSTAFNSSQLVPRAEPHTRAVAVFYLPHFTNHAADCALILMSILYNSALQTQACSF